LNSLWPTGNSPIQTEVPYKIKAMLRWTVSVLKSESNKHHLTQVPTCSSFYPYS
jgi:hypothetical protein